MRALEAGRRHELKSDAARQRGAAEELERKAGPESCARAPLLLIVEADAGERLHLANGLLDEGYDVVEADNPAEAMSILKGRDDFDMLIADVWFGQRYADLGLVRYVSAMRPHTKILIHACPESAGMAIPSPRSAFLAKPSSDTALLAAVADLFARTDAPVARPRSPAPLIARHDS